MRRETSRCAARFGLGGLFVMGVLAAGCAGPGPRTPEPLVQLEAAAVTDAARVRGLAQGLAARAASEATRLRKAREAGDEAAVEEVVASLEDNEFAIDALDEAVRTLELVASYVAQRPRITLASSEIKRLDADVRALREGSMQLAAHATQLVQSRNARDAEAAERARVEIERDQAYLKALRSDLLITARFGRTGGS
jgi:hypothetical protein